MVLVVRTIGAESVSEPMATVDRVVSLERWAIEGVAALSGDWLTSVDWGLGASIGKISYEAVSGDTTTVKQSVTGWLDCPACLSPLARTNGTSTPEIFS